MIASRKMLSQGYKIVRSYISLQHLEKQVKNYCKEGWELQGNIKDKDGVYFQAMVKKSGYVTEEYEVELPDPYISKK